MVIFNADEHQLLGITKRSENLTKEGFKRYFKEVLKDKIVRFVENSNTPALLVVYKAPGGPRIVKAESNRPPETTIKEIQWYRALNNKNKSVPHFYGGAYNNRVAIYELDFLQSYVPLEDAFIKNTTGRQQLSNYISKSIGILFKLYYSKQIRCASLKEAEEMYWHKIRHRMFIARQNPWLKGLLSQERVVINKQKYPGIPSILRRISQEEFRRKFTPRKLGFIHGDLHFGNILVNANSMKLINPNGIMELPIEYDLGKLLHSFHGLYNYIHRKRFSLSFDKATSTYTFHIYSNLDYQQDPQNLLPNSITDTMYREALFSECCHFLTMLPHHAQDVSETTALYLRTLELFQFFFTFIKN